MKRKSNNDSDADKKKQRTIGPSVSSAVSSAKEGGAAVLSAATGVGSMLAAKSPKLSIPSTKSLGADNVTREQMITGFVGLIVVIVATLLIENNFPKLVNTIQSTLALAIAFGGVPLVFLLNRLWGRTLLWTILGKKYTDIASSMINNAAFAMCAVTVAPRFTAMIAEVTTNPGVVIVLHNAVATFLDGFLAGMNCPELDKFRLPFFAIITSVSIFTTLKLATLWFLPLGILAGAASFHVGNLIGAKVKVDISVVTQHLSLVCMAVACYHVYEAAAFSWLYLFAVLAVYVAALLSAGDEAGLKFFVPNVVSAVLFVAGTLICQYAASASSPCGALTQSFLQVFPSGVGSFATLAAGAHSFLAQHPLTSGVFGGTQGAKPALAALTSRLFTLLVFGVVGGLTLMILG